MGLVLNGRGVPAPETSRLSRGALPLLFAATGSLEGLEYDRYDPFHLVCAEPDRVLIAGWNGGRPRNTTPPPACTWSSTAAWRAPTPPPGPAPPR